jgi:RimJ/RimL family protein N-acetyltransferase
MTTRHEARSGDRRLVTARLTLREPQPGDLARYRQVLGADDAERELRDAVAHWRAHGFGPWLVEEADRAVGVLEVHFAGPGVTGIEPDEVEVGWTIAEADRGRGMAFEAARAAIDDVFERVRPPWLVAYIRPENEVSIRLAERLGFTHVGDGLARSGDPMGIYRRPAARR